MQKTQNYGRWMLITSMVIFSTIGILRRHIPYDSSLIALLRGFVGATFLFIVILLRKQSFDTAAIRRNLLLLILSGIAIGANWIFLFEAYRYTSVATATLCYYLAPILVILFSPIVLKERLTRKKLVCAFIALLGMIPVSGILETDFQGVSELKGIIFGLGAAALYASVILINKKMSPIPAYDKTILQLGIAAAALLPYVLATVDFSGILLEPVPVALLLVAGIVHTGIAYWMYFGSIDTLQAHTVALMSYIDPILAIILSAFLLKESMSIYAVIGAIMILGAAFVSERE